MIPLDYNTRVVLAGVAMLGAAAGMVGSFTLLRRRALIGDALAHAALPGITTASLLGWKYTDDAKSLPLLLAGATIGGLMGVMAVVAITRLTRLKQDAALGIVLSVFFGVGVAMMGVIQNLPGGSAAGLENFIYGKTASMRMADARMIGVAAAAAMVVCGLLYKELKLLCFDSDFAGSRGYAVAALDVALMATVVAVAMVGLKAVGLILIVAMLVIPPAAARFWTRSLGPLVIVAVVVGTVGGTIGAAASAAVPRLPSGAMIVLVCAGVFGVSLLFGTARGVVPRWTRRRRLDARIARQHLLRAMYELVESTPRKDERETMFDALLERRSWSASDLRRQIRRASDEEYVIDLGDRVRLTPAGYAEAARLTRQHRLWELYLVQHADVATARVDRDADAIEHVLEPAVVERLETLLDQSPMRIDVPESPHRINGAPA